MKLLIEKLKVNLVPDSPPNHTNQPLTETTFFILLSLAQKPKHGYLIMKDVQELSEDRVILSTGTLYTALKRLLKQGWIERIGENASEKNGRQQKAYRLSLTGKDILNSEIARLEKLLGIIRSRPLMKGVIH